MIKHPIKHPNCCPECDGYCEVECCSCGSVVDCEHCHGEGYDPDVFDTQAYAAACSEMHKTDGAIGSAALVDDGVYVGRFAIPKHGLEPLATVLIEDFRNPLPLPDGYASGYA